MASSGEDRAGERHPAEWDRLEAGVRRLLDEHARWRRRALAAEAKLEALEASLADIAAGGLDPTQLAAKVDSLERDKRELVGRLDRARGKVGTILTRLELLEDDR